MIRQCFGFNAARPQSFQTDNKSIRSVLLTLNDVDNDNDKRGLIAATERTCMKICMGIFIGFCVQEQFVSKLVQIWGSQKNCPGRTHLASRSCVSWWCFCVRNNDWMPLTRCSVWKKSVFNCSLELFASYTPWFFHILYIYIYIDIPPNWHICKEIHGNTFFNRELL